jgi:hypothetical protein
MPIKFKESAKNKDGSMQNYYMRSTPLQELKAAFDNDHTPPKKKQKILRELVKRGEA